MRALGYSTPRRRVSLAYGGSLRQATDVQGAVTAAREWTPYGVEIGDAQPGLGYAGEWFDADVEAQYLRARWYDVATGRFTSEDPWEGDYERPHSLNPYLYVLVNPVNILDPSGQQCIGCNTSGDWAEYTLYYAYGIRLKQTVFLFSESEKLLILETVEDYSELLGGRDIFGRNLTLSRISMDWVTKDGSFNAYYNSQDETITLPPNWYSPRIAIAPNGTALMMLANPCLEEMLNFPKDSLPTDEIEAKFVLAHEIGHAFHTGNPGALHIGLLTKWGTVGFMRV